MKLGAMVRRRSLHSYVTVLVSMAIGSILTSTIIFQFLWCTSISDTHTTHNTRNSLSINTQKKCVCGEELVSPQKKASSGDGGERGVLLKQPDVLHKGLDNTVKPDNKEMKVVRPNSTIPLSDTILPYEEGGKLMVAIIMKDGPPTWLEAVYETWGREASSILFFVSRDFNYNHSSVTGLPLVRISNENKSSSASSPLSSANKMVSVIKYLTELYSTSYQWFLLAAENSYVRIDKLNYLLSKLNPADKIYLGRSASGRKEDENRLGLKPHEHYCLGNSGIVLSSGLLSSHLVRCLESERSDVPGDVVLGKCISRILGTQCTQSKKIQSYFFEDYSSKLINNQVIENYPIPFSSLISYHPLQKLHEIYILHHVYKKIEFEAYLNKVNLIQDELKEMCAIHDFPPNCVPSLYSSQSGEVTTLRTPYRPTTIYDYQPWQYFNVHTLYHDQMTQPSYKMRIQKNHKTELQQSLKKAVKKCSERFGRQLKLKEVLNGWVRHNPYLGNEYIFDLFLMTGNHKTVPLRVNLVQPISSNYIVVNDNADSAAFVNMVVPISKVNQRFREFMEMYESLALSTKESVRLILVVYGEKDVRFVNNIVGTYQDKYPLANMSVLMGKGEFSRSKALHYGISHLKTDDLIFVCDVDMVVTLPFLDRCRRNTIQKSRVYYPEFFKLYNLDYVYWNKPHPSTVTLKREHGHWAYYSFGMVCIYKSDYDSVGGMDTNIAGWGDEDVHFFQKVIRKRLDVLRAPDTGLSHKWHEKVCPKTLSTKQHKHCLSSQQENLADRKELARYVYELGVNIKGKSEETVPILTNNLTNSEEEDYNNF